MINSKKRIYIKNNQYVTMFNLSWTKFFQFLKINTKIKKEFDEHMKSDITKSLNISPPESVVEMWKNNKVLGKKNPKVCILTHNNKYIGSLRYYKQNTFIDNHKLSINNQRIFIKIGVLYIVPKYRKQGLAFNMLNFIINKNNKYLLNVHYKNKSAIALYKKFGFKKSSSSDGFLTLIIN